MQGKACCSDDRPSHVATPISLRKTAAATAATGSYEGFAAVIELAKPPCFTVANYWVVWPCPSTAAPHLLSTRECCCRRGTQAKPPKSNAEKDTLFVCFAPASIVQNSNYRFLVVMA